MPIPLRVGHHTSQQCAVLPGTRLETLPDEGEPRGVGAVLPTPLCGSVVPQGAQYCLAPRPV